MKRALIASLALAASMINACAYKVNPYGLSSSNIEQLKAAKVKPLAVTKFESYKPGLNSITCRAAGPVTVAGSFESYIEKAFIDELKVAGLYDPSSPLVIAGRLEEVDFNSNIGSGKWILSLTVSSKSKPGYRVDSTYQFSPGFVADKACQEVAQAFGPAVQKLINDVVSNPKFKDLAI